MKYETKETINNLSMCSAMFFFVPMILGMQYMLKINPNDIVAILCIIFEIVSVGIMVITTEM
jgi:hypothetical protein